MADQPATKANLEEITVDFTAILTDLTEQMANLENQVKNANNNEKQRRDRRREQVKVPRGGKLLDNPISVLRPPSRRQTGTIKSAGLQKSSPFGDFFSQAKVSNLHTLQKSSIPCKSESNISKPKKLDTIIVEDARSKIVKGAAKNTVVNYGDDEFDKFEGIYGMRVSQSIAKINLKIMVFLLSLILVLK